MYLQFQTIEQAESWLSHNDALVGYPGSRTRSLSQPIEGADGIYYISLSPERWNSEGLAEPLELLDGEIVESFERKVMEA